MSYHLRGYKIEIYPTEEQKQLITKHINTYRAVYNNALAIQLDNYDNGGKYISFYKMEHQFSDMRNNDPEYKWLNNISIGVIREALADLHTAFEFFFRNINRFPKFKSKKKSKKTFGTRSDRCKSHENYIYISGIGLVYAKNHNIPIDSKLYDTRVTFDGHSRYYFTCMADTEKICEIEDLEYTDNIIGIDVGIRNMITTSDGEVFKYSDKRKYEKRHKRQQRRMSKYYNRYLEEAARTKTKYEDIPKSKNMKKKAEKLYQTVQKLRNKTMNDIHTATKRIVDQMPKAIVIENLSVAELHKDKWFAKRNPYPYFYEIRRQLEYKAEDRGIKVIVADKSFPSSQICSNCGTRHKIYSNKLFICKKCGLRIDRDLNAALNLRNLALS